MKGISFIIISTVVIPTLTDDTQEPWVVCIPSGKKFRGVDVTIEDYDTKPLINLFDGSNGENIEFVEGQNYFPKCNSGGDPNCDTQFQYFVECNPFSSSSCDNCVGVFGGTRACGGSVEYSTVLRLNASDTISDCYCDVFERVRGKRINHVLGFSENCEMPFGTTDDIIQIQMRDIDNEFVKEDCKFIQNEFDMHLCGLTFDPETYIDDNLDDLLDFTKRSFSVSELELDVIGYKFEEGKVIIGQRRFNSTITFNNPVIFNLFSGGILVSRVRFERSYFEIQIPPSEMLKKTSFSWSLKTDEINWFRDFELVNGTFMWNAGTLLPKIQIFNLNERRRLSQCDGIVGDGVIYCNEDGELVDYMYNDMVVMYYVICLVIYISLLSSVCVVKQMNKGNSFKYLIMSMMFLSTNAAFCTDSNALNKVMSVKSSFPTTLNGISTYVHNHDFTLSGKESSLCINVMDEKNEDVLFSVKFSVTDIRKEYGLENIYSTYTIDTIEKPSYYDTALCLDKQNPLPWISEGFAKITQPICRQISGTCVPGKTDGCNSDEKCDVKITFGDTRTCCKVESKIEVEDPVATKCWLDPSSNNHNNECKFNEGDISPKFCNRGGTNFFIRKNSPQDFFRMLSTAPFTALIETSSPCGGALDRPSFTYNPDNIFDKTIDRQPRLKYQEYFGSRLHTLCNPKSLDSEFNVNGGYQVAIERYCNVEFGTQFCEYFNKPQNQAVYTMLKFTPKNFYRVYKINAADNVDAVATIRMDFEYANGTKFTTSKEQQLSKISGAIPFFEQGDLKVQIEDIGQILGAEPKRSHIFQGTGIQRPDKLFQINDKGVYFVNALDVNTAGQNLPGLIQCTKVDANANGRDRCRLVNKGACAPKSGAGNTGCGTTIFENGRDKILGPFVFKNEKDSSGKTISKSTLQEISDPDVGNTIKVNGEEIKLLKFQNKVTTVGGTNILNKLQVFSPVGGAVKFKLETRTSVGVFKADVTPECSLADKLGPSGFFGSDIGFSFNVTIRSKDNPGQVAVIIEPIDDIKEFDPDMTLFPTRLIIGTETQTIMLVGNTGIANNNFKVIFKSHNAQCEVATTFIASPIDKLDTLPPAPGLTLIPTFSPTVKATGKFY